MTMVREWVRLVTIEVGDLVNPFAPVMADPDKVGAWLKVTEIGFTANGAYRLTAEDANDTPYLCEFHDIAAVWRMVVS
jgi:uncharacterized ParB-like nuclease family protein